MTPPPPPSSPPTIKGLAAATTALEPTTPAHFDLTRLIRPNILALEPYRCARDDFEDGVLLDANENALGHAIPLSDPLLSQLPSSAPLNRYPSPSHPTLKARLASLRGLPSADYVHLGVGSDEVIDLLMRVSCTPGRPKGDKILVCPPTYGMYGVTAQVNDVEVVTCPLITQDGRFEVDLDKLSALVAADPSIKLIFLCSPGNPTGTLIPLATIRAVLENVAFKGLVVVDEAYIDFAGEPQETSAVTLVERYANVCVSQTLSKGHGLAAIRLGVAYGSPALIQILSNTKAPYNISSPTAALAQAALTPSALVTFHTNVATLLANRAWLLTTLPTIEGLGRILGRPHANFVLVEVVTKDGKPSNDRAKRAYLRMATDEGVVVRFRGNELGCEGCLRITVGTRQECERAVDKLRLVLAEDGL